MIHSLFYHVFLLISCALMFVIHSEILPRVNCCMYRGVAREGTRGTMPPQSLIEWIFYGKKLALLGRSNTVFCGPQIRQKCIDAPHPLVGWEGDTPSLTPSPRRLHSSAFSFIVPPNVKSWLPPCAYNKLLDLPVSS